jgi:hypothetical protein
MSTLLIVVELQIEIPRIAREVATEHCRARLEEENARKRATRTACCGQA